MPKKEIKKIKTNVLKWMFLVFMIVGIIGLFLYVYDSYPTGSFIDGIVRSPELSISDLNWDIGYSSTQGCHKNITGVVKNQGYIDAENVYVKCSLYRNGGGVLGTFSAYLGTVYVNTNKAFRMKMEFSCLPGLSEINTNFDCKVDCSNC